MSEVGDLATCDPVAAVSGFLASPAATRTRAALDALPPPPAPPGGWPYGESRVLGVVAPPYPMLRVISTPGGSMNDMRWLLSPEVLIEAWGDEQAWPGPAALRALLLSALADVKTLPEQDYGPGQAVVTGVDAATPPQPLADPGGQERWFAAVVVHMHPPSS